ncbi:TonB-dependent receptor [Filimonas lacunae]|nr:TonB-dependent receptor [Filimonas lacunae]
MTFMVMLCSTTASFAQNGTLFGTILSDDDGLPLTEVTVTNQRTGKKTITGKNGTYTIAGDIGDTLSFSYIGYTTSVVSALAQQTIRLVRSQEALGDVVVTAFGIKKEKKALGYAVQDIKGEELLKNKTPNVINALNGKIAGLNITNSNGAPGSSAQIVIRGGTSVLESSDNQPLFVIDGIPIDNSTPVGNTAYDKMGAAAASFGNRAMDINPDDIESISVLKGPSAAALYGLRAAAGAIVITTKKGKEGTTQVALSSRFSANRVARLPQQQNKFKQGNAITPTVPSYLSWGSAFTGADTVYNNLQDFFQTGYGIDNNISISGGSKNGNYFLSAQRFDQTGTVPTTDYRKTALRYNGEQKLGWFTFGANASYTYTTTTRALTGGGLYNSSGMGYMMAAVDWPRNNNMADYLHADGSKKRLLASSDLADDIENPYWLVHNNPITDKTNRFTGAAFTRVKPLSWLEFSYKLGLDYYVTKINSVTMPGSAVSGDLQKGGISQNDREVSLLSSTFLITAQKKINKDFDVNVLLGQTTEMNNSTTDYRVATGFLVPNFISINNSAVANKLFQQSIGRRRLVGVYGDLRLAFRNIAYADVTGRNDWSSTLPEQNRSFFYPSVSGSFIFTELLPKSNILSFGKLRASWSQVGKDAPPYKTTTALDVPQTTLGGGYIDSYTAGNPNLKPETTTSTEFGTELRLFNNKVGLDFTWYRNLSKDQIVSPRVSQGLGYIYRYVNAGKIENKGIEIAISATPVKKAGFEWSTNVNISHNNGRVLELPGSIPILYVTEAQYGYVKAASFNNGVFLGMSGNVWQTVANGEHAGKLILNATTGLPTTSTATATMIGDREPDMLLGWNNNFTYKNFNLNFLLDARIGGDVFNGTEYEMMNTGMSKLTENRGQTVLMKGVINTGTTADPVYQDFSKEVVMDQNYYVNYYAFHSPNFITKVNWLRMRSVALGYHFPQRLLANKLSFVKSLDLLLAVQNVFLITNYKGMDPEVSAAGAGAGGSGSSGMDYLGTPPTRTFTLGFNIKF